MSAAEEEQLMELEALESIYPTELKVVSNEAPREYELKVSAAGSDMGSADDDDDGDAAISCKLHIRLPTDYPTEGCQMTVHGSGKLTNEWTAQLQKVVDQSCSDAAADGSVAIFLVTTAVQEWLADHADAMSRRAAQPTPQQRAAEEAASAASAIKKPSPLGIEPGTLVTLESFTAWKRLFDAERESLKTTSKSSAVGSKLTGKQLFLQNKVSEVDEETASRMTEETLPELKQPHVFDEALFDDEDDDGEFLPSDDDEEDG